MRIRHLPWLVLILIGVLDPNCLAGATIKGSFLTVSRAGRWPARS